MLTEILDKDSWEIQVNILSPLMLKETSSQSFPTMSATLMHHHPKGSSFQMCRQAAPEENQMLILEEITRVMLAQI